MLNSNTNRETMSDLNDPIRTRSTQADAERFLKRNNKRRVVRKQSFAQKEIDVKAFIIAPEGYEAFMFTVYGVTLPYLFGLAFLYMFVAKGNFVQFLNVKLSSFFIIWMIGYEVIAVISLTLIGYAFIKSLKNSSSEF